MTGWWEGCERFVATDPRDVGCDEATAPDAVVPQLLFGAAW